MTVWPELSYPRGEPYTEQLALFIDHVVAHGPLSHCCSCLSRPAEKQDGRPSGAKRKRRKKARTRERDCGSRSPARSEASGGRRLGDRGDREPRDSSDADRKAGPDFPLHMCAWCMHFR